MVVDKRRRARLPVSHFQSEKLISVLECRTAAVKRNRRLGVAGEGAEGEKEQSGHSMECVSRHLRGGGGYCTEMTNKAGWMGPSA